METIVTGFWQERLRILEEMSEEQSRDDFDAFGFGFLESENIGNGIFENTETFIKALMEANKAVDETCAKSIVGNYSAYNFLHGDCNIFAQYLNKEFGYKVGAVFQEDESGNKQLVHMFGIYHVDEYYNAEGYDIYIDVRGMCTNFEYFMKEFYDNGLYDPDDSVLEIYNAVPEKYKTSAEDRWRYDFAEELNTVMGYYDMECCA